MVELLIVLAVIAVMLTLAAPAVQTVAARADIKRTADDISQAIRLAKNTARVTSQPVTVSITTGTSANSISFLFANGTNTANGLTLPAIDLPTKVSIATQQQQSLTFDSMGVIAGFRAGSIRLRSTVDTSQALTVTVVNNLGYITIAEGAVADVVVVA